MTSKIRSLLVGASVVVIVLGTFKMAMTLLDAARAADYACHGKFGRCIIAGLSLLTVQAATPAPTLPSMTSPVPIGRQSFNHRHS